MSYYIAQGHPGAGGEPGLSGVDGCNGTRGRPGVPGIHGLDGLHGPPVSRTPVWMFLFFSVLPLFSQLSPHMFFSSISTKHRGSTGVTQQRRACGICN